MPQMPLVANVALKSGSYSALSLDTSGNLKTVSALTYVTVAASQTKATLGTGAIGDVLSQLVIVPATTSPGAVGLYDSSSGTEIVIFAGGATSVADLAPITVMLNATSTAGGWEVTTGANVSVIAVGKFTV